MHYTTIFSILFFSVCVVSLVIGILVLQNNRKAPANISFFVLIIAICIWSVGLALSNSATNETTSENWRRFSAYGWGTAYAITLHFFLIVTGSISLFKKWWSYFLLYLPALITLSAFAIPIGINKSAYELHLTEFGWVNKSGTTVWDWIFYIYYVGYLITGMILVLRWHKKSSDEFVKIQSRIIFISFGTALVLATITDVLLNSMSAKLPQMAPIIMLIPISAIFFIVQKYGFIAKKSVEKEGSYVGIIFSVIIYIILAFLISGRATGLFEIHKLNNMVVKGVITQAQLVISIYLVLKENKPGFIASVILNINSLLNSITYLIQNKSTESVPGIISYLTVLMIVTLIYVYKKKTAENFDEINKQRISLEESEKKLSHIAFYDSLTGLPNKELFIDHLNRSVYTASRNASLIGIVFVDIDNFKSINDTKGHSTGDMLLKQIAERLSSCLREQDIVARFGGDEFIAKIADIENVDDLHHITNRITDVFKAPFTIQGEEYFNSVSVGVAVYPVDGEDSETLVRNADIAMNLAKSNGKNRCVYCTSDMKNDIIRKLKLTNNMYRALDKNEFFLHYQPQIRTDTQEIIGFEALLRWSNDEFGLISPVEFIPIAEQTGLIRAIGLWVIRTVCEQYKVFRSCYDKDFSISVNLSLEQVKDIKIVDKIQKIFLETDTDPRSIQIEITESAALSEDPYVLERLRDIKKTGISISIDDFGKGYSSFSRLKMLLFDLLKIDIDFVRGISSGSHQDKAIIKTIIQLSDNLGIDVLAEGVETEDQLLFLRENGCDFIQGYYFYKPIPAEEVVTLLKKKKADNT